MIYTTLYKDVNTDKHFNNLIVTHEDLDGIVSAKIIHSALKFNKETSYIVAHFSPKEGTTTSIIYDILFNQKITVDKIWILDRQTLTEKGYEMIRDKISELMVIDHHVTQLASEYYYQLSKKYSGKIFRQTIINDPIEGLDYEPSAALKCYHFILSYYDYFQVMNIVKTSLKILATLTSLWDTFRFKYLEEGILKNAVLTLQALCSYHPAPIFFDKVSDMILNDDSLMYLDLEDSSSNEEFLSFFNNKYKLYLDNYNNDINKIYSYIIDDNLKHKIQLMNLPFKENTYKTLIAYYNHDIALMSSVADKLLNSTTKLDILIFITPLGNISVRINKDIDDIMAIDVCSLVCEKYGGHPKAAGGSMIEDVNQLFIEKFLTYLKIDNVEEYLIDSPFTLNADLYS